jgi:hypothetical protein
MSVWLLLLMGALFVLYVVVTAGAVMKHYWGLAVLMTVLAVAIGAVLLNFFVLSFAVTPTMVVFGFGLVKKRFPRESIVSCEPFELTFSNYLGYGIRIGMDRTVAYNTRNGQGVKLTVEGAKREYVVSVDDPAYICKLLASDGDSA